MQTYILHLREAQALVEARERQIRRELCKEIRTFAKVKAAWDLGPIKVVQRICPRNGNRKMRVYGTYVDQYSSIRTVLLGLGLDRAYYRVWGVKYTLFTLPHRMLLDYIY